MKISNWCAWTLGSVAVIVSLGVPGPRARAFGGLWAEPSGRVEHSSEAIIFVDNPDGTITSIVQLTVAGAPRRFAWVIPVPGVPTVGVSSNTLFERLDAATAPQYWLEQAAEGMCLESDEPDDLLDGSSGTSTSPSARDTATAAVVLLDRGSVGPYDYVTITVDPTVSDTEQSVRAWLEQNGYAASGVESLQPYLRDGLNLLAFKLTTGLDTDTDTESIRPVTLTYAAELPAIPLRPTALSAHGELGVRVWVFGPSQAVPANYRSLVLNDAVIDWQSGRRYFTGTLPGGGVNPAGSYESVPANYHAVVTAAADEVGGHGFVTELAELASQYRDKVWSPLDDEHMATLRTQTPDDGIDAIIAASVYFGGWDGFREAVSAATQLPPGLTLAEFARDPEAYRSRAKVDTARFLELLEEKVVRPVSETAALLYNAPYLTRLYASLSADEMTLDPVFDYNTDLVQVSRVHVAMQVRQCDAEVYARDAPWHIALPQGGVVVGEGAAWPVRLDSMPANLKVVKLGAHGSGEVVTDHSQEIWSRLSESAGGAPPAAQLTRPPQNGPSIGGTQSVTPYTGSEPAPSGPQLFRDDSCSIAVVRAADGGRPRLWVLFLGVLLSLRLGRRQFARARRGSRAATHLLTLACAIWTCVGCSSDNDLPLPADAGMTSLVTGEMTDEQLRDPETCKGCHPIHYREWAASMHAYAARDPVFIAMNQRGQRETHGELGDFCVKCHAPMAVLDKRTRDGLNLDQLPDKDRGVSCYFCHNAIGIDGDHNAMLRLANDSTMRGPIHDPLQPGVHRAEFSELFDENSSQSSAMCGGCHDIVTPTGVHLERTFEEFRYGLFSKSGNGEPPPFATCVGCHMPGQQALAAVAPAGTVTRTIHEHLWPAVDVALTDFPHRDAMRSAVEDCQLGALSVSFFTLEVTPPDIFSFQLETNAGHNQPSGAAEDRRLWLEFMAYDEHGALLKDVSSGNIADGEVEEWPVTDPRHDPRLLMFSDHIYDAQGKPVHMFWEAAPSKEHPQGYESRALPVATTTYVEGKHAVLKQYRASGPNGMPARVTARLRMRPIGMDVLNDLVASGDLDRKVIAEMPTFTLGAELEWTPEMGVKKTIASAARSDCVKYRCLLDPAAPECL